MVCVKINGKTFERTVNYISVCGGSELTQVSVALSSGFLPDYKHRHSNEILLAPYVEVNTEFMKIVARRMKVKYVTIIQSIMFRLFIYLTTCLYLRPWPVGSLSPGHAASSVYGWRRLPQIRSVAAYILNKQSRTADKRWSLQLRDWARC